MRHHTAFILSLVASGLIVFDGEQVIAEASRRVVLPAELSLPAMTSPNGVLHQWNEIESKFKAGDPYIRRWVSRTMVSAKGWADRPDSYYLGLFRPESPFGRHTIRCPFHPHMPGWLPFDWDPDHPWRLTCPLCKKEGRKLYYYPNELYRDDGKGCRPTDDLWQKTHTLEWSAKHGIPWQKWDGRTHSSLDGFAFFFRGYTQFRIFWELNFRRDILGRLCRGYVFGTRLYPPDSAERKLADVCAHKARIIMVTMARAIMGDPYLRDVLDVDARHYRKAIRALAIGPDGKPLPYKEYPGYEKRDVISDHSANHPKHPISSVRGHWRRQITIFPDRQYSAWSRAWLASYAMIQGSFTPVQRKAKLTDLIERLLVSKAGDAERLKKKGGLLKRGVIERGMHPYDLTMRGNMASVCLSNLELGLMLKDREVVRNVADDVWYYLRNYFTADGLGHEISPSYTNLALAHIRQTLAAINGMTEGFGPGDSFWDPRTKALNPYLDPALSAAVHSTLLSVLPDGRCAAWADSHVTTTPVMKYIEDVTNAAGGVPERFKPWLDVSKDAKGKFHITLKKELTLPSYILGSNRLAVMRAGAGLDQTFVSVDCTRFGGHCHTGPFNLLLYGARHEMLYDQGYITDTTPTQRWMDSPEAHNTAVVRMADGSTSQCVKWRGSLRFFADEPAVKAVEVAEEDAALLKPAGKDAMYRRTVVLMAAASPYVVDIFRLRGGTTHDYYVHSLGRTLTLTGATLKPVADQKQSLYDVSGFEYRTTTGAKFLTGISRTKTDGTFTAAWSDMRDWRTVPPEIDKDAVTRVRILGMGGTEVFVGNAPGRRYYKGARDLAERVKVMCVRRKAEAFSEVPDAFVAVIDAVRGKADNIRQIRQLKVLSGDKTGVGVKITRPGGVDYILSTTHDDVATVFGDLDFRRIRTMTLTGRLGVIRIEPRKSPSLLLVQGKHLAIGKRSVSAAAATLDGRLVGFNNSDRVLTVASDAAIPTGTKLAGRVLIVRHKRQTDGFTIRRIDRLGPGRYAIAVSNVVRLARCMVRVKSVTGELMAIEPSPIVRHEGDDFFMYREDATGQAILLGPYRGGQVALPKSEDLKPGTRLLITALHVGEDTVSIPVISRTGKTTRTDK